MIATEPIHRILDATTLSRGVPRWSIAAMLALGLPLACVIASAQERLTFEAASVKSTAVPDGVSVSGTSIRMTGGSREDFERLTHNTGGPGTSDPGRIHYPLETLKGLLRNAYGSSYFEIVAPGWADTDTVSVDATMPPDTTRKQFREMLQNLLIDRFALKTHVETKEITGYVMTVARNGLKLKQSEISPAENPDDGTPQPRPREIGPDGFPIPPRRIGSGFLFSAAPGERSRMMGQQKTMDDLAEALGKLLDSKVVDATGLTATYDITLTYAGHLGGPNGVQALSQAPAASADPATPEPLPDIFAALQSQLGLKLERKKISVEILVVDRMEKAPIGN
jgi:uncharacterized protein (TIGR03435 family)